MLDNILDNIFIQKWYIKWEKYKWYSNFNHFYINAVLLNLQSSKNLEKNKFPQNY